MDVTVNFLFCDVGFWGISGFPHDSPVVVRLAQGLQTALYLPMKRRPGKPNFCQRKKTENLRMSSKKGPFQKERIVLLTIILQGIC